MKIIGEKINGTRQRVAQAIAEKDAAFIQDLAKKQVECGAHWLDINAGTHPSREPDDLKWLVHLVQDVVDVPLCLDSANSNALCVALKEVKKTPIINSISGELTRLNDILPIVAEQGCEVIALCLDEEGIPATAEARLDVIRKVFAQARRLGVPDQKVYVDPLVMTLSTNIKSAQVTFETMRRVRQEYPEAHLTIGLSNISFGLPARSYINRYFLCLALQIGLDSAILDPMDHEIQAAILAAELLAGRDAHCLNFIRASRKGIFDQTDKINNEVHPST